MIFSITFIIASISIAIAWFFFIYKKLSQTEEAWKWASQSIATFLSVLIGLSVFSLQQNWSHYTQNGAIKDALIEELQIITSQLKESDGIPICDPLPNQENLKIYPVSLPHAVIKTAIESILLEPNLMRHLLLLNSLIEDYNRLADIGFQLMTKPDQDFDRQLAIHNQIIMPTKQNILLKSQLLIECINDGTSSLDADCY